MRGQAFVSFASADIAKKALKEVKGFPLYSKPMVVISSPMLTTVYLTFGSSKYRLRGLVQTR
jgi:hypothetical protein